MESNTDVTGLLLDWGRGDRDAYNRLIPLVYDELRRLAGRYLHRERSDHTLQPTALVHEAFVRLIDQREVRWSNRAQFFGLAAQAMRRILVDYARSRVAQKRGGSAIRLSITAAAEGGEVAHLVGVEGVPDVDLLDLDDALRALAELDPTLVRVVELRYFGGLTIDETAAALEVSPATVKRDWSAARAWLFRRLSGGGPA